METIFNRLVPENRPEYEHTLEGDDDMPAHAKSTLSGVSLTIPITDGRCDKASFCVIEQDDVHPEKYTTFFRSVIAFGRIHIVEDETERHQIARMLGNRYNPNQDEALQKEMRVACRVCWPSASTSSI